jgi:hypothetical protein
MQMGFVMLKQMHSDFDFEMRKRSDFAMPIGKGKQMDSYLQTDLTMQRAKYSRSETEKRMEIDFLTVIEKHLRTLMDWLKQKHFLKGSDLRMGWLKLKDFG